MIRNLLFALHLFFIFPLLSIPEDSVPEESFVVPADEAVTISIGTELARKHDMLCSGFGGSSDDKGRIKTIELAFQSLKIVTVDQARKIIVNFIEEYLAILNDMEEMKPYLTVHPFTAENLRFTIFFGGIGARKVYDPYPSDVMSNKGKIVYRMLSPENKYSYSSRISESYEEAFVIVEKEKLEKKSLSSWNVNDIAPLPSFARPTQDWLLDEEKKDESFDFSLAAKAANARPSSEKREKNNLPAVSTRNGQCVVEHGVSF